MAPHHTPADSTAYRDAWAAAHKPEPPSTAPIYIVIVVFIGVCVVAAMLAWNHRANHHTVALPAQYCAPPKPGQVLIVTIAPQDANGEALTTCQLIASQGALRERVAKAGAR